MKLMTKAIKRKIPALYATDGNEDALCIVKYFDPCGSWSWFAFEFDGVDTFFGYVIGLESEWGYFSLSELQGIKGRLGIGIERDLYYTPQSKKELSEDRQAYHRDISS